MQIELEYAGLEREFRKAGANLFLSENLLKLRVRSADAANWFVIPTTVEANKNRLPGWFSAGIWDMMDLRGLNELPDAMWLEGWGFTHEAGVWRLSIGEVQQLVYNSGSGILSIYNYSAGSSIDTEVFPAKSLFHAQKAFEENGWFIGESPVESLEIRDYLGNS